MNDFVGNILQNKY